MQNKLSRRAVLAGSAALPLVAIGAGTARAAKYTLRLATGQAPSHPVNIRAGEAIARLAKATGGALEIKLFPNNVLGSDPDLITQVRSGGVDMINMASSILATLVPAAAITNLGFAFSGYPEVWKAMDGGLGHAIASEIGKRGITQVGRAWDNGFRQITSSKKPILSPADLKGFKIRVPPAPMLTSLFQSLGAAPSPIAFNEVYTSLQTGLVGGQENPLAIIYTAKLYEVQKFCSLSGHSWDAYLMLAHPASLARLPAKMREMVIAEFDRAGQEERADSAKLAANLQAKLTQHGMTFHSVDKAAFRTALRKTDYYPSWKAKFGPELWKTLESTTGALG